VSPSISVRLLQTQSDARLLAAAREGHERAFEALVQRYRRPLLRYCRRLLLPEERAEDALQQAWLQAWLALQRGGEIRDAKAWLYRVAHNSAIDSLRATGYDHEQLRESLRGADAPQSDLERRIAVRQALVGLAALPELQREALLRTAIEGHSHEQVAAALGLSDGAVRGLVYRARATLRAVATAVTPPSLFVSIAGTAHRGAPLAQRLSEVCAGAAGGATSASGGLLKVGGVFLAAGALVAGAMTAPHHLARHASAQTAGAARGESAGALDTDLDGQAQPAAALVRPGLAVTLPEGRRRVSRRLTRHGPEAVDAPLSGGRNGRIRRHDVSTSPRRTSSRAREIEAAPQGRAEGPAAASDERASGRDGNGDLAPAETVRPSGSLEARSESGTPGEGSAERPEWGAGGGGGHDTAQHGGAYEPGTGSGGTQQGGEHGAAESEASGSGGGFGDH
jgi:RNA polymerase sigma factor (sigma-70 family)